MTAANGPRSGDEPDVLAYVSASLDDVLSSLDAARAATATAIVWTRIAITRRDDEGVE